MKNMHWLILAVSLASITANSVRAGIVLEYDFRTAQTNATGALNQATVVANGGSPDADLIKGATIHDAATALGAGYDPRIATGYLSVRPVDNDTDQALGTANTINGPDHLMKQYMGYNNFTEGSVVMVIKPQFDGLDANRRTFFWHGSDNNSNNLVWLLNNDDLKGPALVRNQGTLVSLPNVAWDSDTWYLLAASWKANLANNDENTLYLRALSPMSAALFNVEDVVLLDSTTPMDQPIYLGRRADSGVDNGNSDIALFQLYNNALTVSDFNNIYNELALIPEPASLHLFAVGFAALACRARRRHR